MITPKEEICMGPLILLIFFLKKSNKILNNVWIYFYFFQIYSSYNTYMNLFSRMHICAWCLWSTKADIRSPEAEVLDDWESPYRHWEQSCGLPQVLSEFLRTEPTL